MAEGRKMKQIIIEDLAKMAYDEDRNLRLPTCGKLEYAGLMCKWEDIGMYNQDIWRAIVIKLVTKILDNMILAENVEIRTF